MGTFIKVLCSVITTSFVIVYCYKDLYCNCTLLSRPPLLLYTDIKTSIVIVQCYKDLLLLYSAIKTSIVIVQCYKDLLLLYTVIKTSIVIVHCYRRGYSTWFIVGPGGLQGEHTVRKTV